MTDPAKGNIFKKLENAMEKPAVFYGSTGVMIVVVIAVLIYWFGFYVR